MNIHKMNRCTHERIDELTTEMIAPGGAPRTSRTQGTEHLYTDMTALASGINTVPRTGAYQHMHACKGVSNSGNGHMHSPPRCRLGTFSISQPSGRSPCRASSRRQLHFSHSKTLTRAQKTALQHRSTVARVSRYRLQHACGRDGVGVRANVSASCFSL